MKHKLKFALLPWLCLTMLSSCSDESLWKESSDAGRISLNVSADHRVMRNTRADDGVSPVVPLGNSFSVQFTSTDGRFSKKWTSVEAFNKENSFPIGDYSIVATYGDVDVQGFENPFYSGEANVHVSPGAEIVTEVVATLANSMVSVRYTEQFAEHFPAYSAAVQSVGHDWVVFAQAENRPAYVAPGEVKLNLTLTNEFGEKVTIQPAGFTAQPRHHYVVTIGVTGNVDKGDLALDVQFDEDVVAESVVVSLGEDLFTAPAPTVTAKGFDPEITSECFEASAPASLRPQFHVLSFGGMKEVSVNIITDSGYVPSFGTNVQLINASDVVQKQLYSEGLACSGFFKNVDKMGVIEVSDFLATVPPGKYSVEVQAVDVMTRASEPLKFNFQVLPLEIECSSPHLADFYASELTVDVSSNSPDIKDKVRFQVPDENNRYQNVEIKSVVPVKSNVRTRSGLEYVFRYVLKIQQSVRNNIDVKAFVGRKERSFTIPVSSPEYGIEVDAFSHKVRFKLSNDNQELLKNLVNNISVWNGPTQIPTSNIKHFVENGIIEISGLNAANTYPSFKLNISGFEKEVPTFTTEPERLIPNGNFGELTTTINIPSINAGGQYKYGATTMQNKSSISVSEPTSWASINQKTAYVGSEPMNTWFVVPSTTANSGEVLIRSVAFDHNGSLPELDNHGLAVRAKYSRNAPAAFSSYAAGELFLGNYSYDGAEHRTDGVAFNSRPSGISFNYKYEAINSMEKGWFEIQVLDEDGKILASGVRELNPVSEYSQVQVPLSYSLSDFSKKAASLRVLFKSSNATSVSAPIPSDLKDVTNTTSLSGITIGTNSYKSLCVGSKLWVQNVGLIY